MSAASGPVTRLAATIPDGDTAFVTSLMRGRSVSGREVLARRATGGAAGDDQLRALGVSLSHNDSARQREIGAKLVARSDRALLAAYAYAVAVQLGDPPDQRAALGLLHALAESKHPFVTRDAEVYAQLLLTAGRLDEAAAAATGASSVRAAVRSVILADAINPALRLGAPEQPWIDALSAALVTTKGGAPITLTPAGRTAFDRLTLADSTVRPGSVDGPLIAVVMSAFNPDERLLTAVHSMTVQTWGNWELLIVDDASPEPTPGILERAEAMDPRVRVIRKAVNGGTYRARNTALTQTRGEYFTCLDSDDWAHPQRLERGIAAMLLDPGLMATRSMCVRADENLVVSRPGYHGHLVNAPSLMVRMYPAVARVGLFDVVRKAADTEYALRLEAAFGVPVLTLRSDIMTMARHEATSLSFGEFSPGWRHEARSAYRQAYGRWHAQIREGADPYLDPTLPRKFPAPRRWQSPIDARLAEPTPFDVVLLEDLRAGAPGVGSAAETAAACAASGLSVGLLHVEDLWAYAAQEVPLDPAILALIDAGAVERTYLEDTVAVDVVVVPTPAVLQFPPWAARSFTPNRLLIATADLTEGPASAKTGAGPAAGLATATDGPPPPGAGPGLDAGPSPGAGPGLHAGPSPGAGPGLRAGPAAGLATDADAPPPLGVGPGPGAGAGHGAGPELGAGAGPGASPDPERYDVGDVERHTDALFRVRPTWVPAAQLTGGALAEALRRAKAARTARADRDAIAARRRVEADAAAGAPDAWLTIRTRRPGDGEHADSIAVRFVAGDAGRAAAIATMRGLVEAIGPGEPVSIATAAAAMRPGVDLIAQQISGAVHRFPA